MTEPTSGICFFAYNNNKINYVHLAVLAALYAKKNMPSKNVCLLTDNGTWAYAESSIDNKLLDDVIDDVVITADEHKSNLRTHYDSPWTKFHTEFKNSNKHKVFEYTPYDNTLLLDIDYIVQNNSLEYIFDSNSNVTMHQDAIGLRHTPPSLLETYLEPQGIPMWWSTVVYFDQSELSKLFFDTWAHVADNYEYYKFIYNFPGTLFRTDYCVSIAVHLLNGMTSGNVIDKFVPSTMINMEQKDEIHEIKDVNDWIFKVASVDSKEHWKHYPVRVKDTNVHCMNKQALLREYDNLLEKFGYGRTK